MFATLHVATLPRSLECLPRYMLLRCRDLWNACHVTCCYAAESSGMLATLYAATLPRALECGGERGNFRIVSWAVAEGPQCLISCGLFVLQNLLRLPYRWIRTGIADVVR